MSLIEWYERLQACVGEAVGYCEQLNIWPQLDDTHVGN